MRRTGMIVLAALLTAGIVLAGCAQPAPSPEPAPKPTIKIGEVNWGSARFQAQLAAIIIEEGYGYPVEVVPAKTIFLLESMRLGEVDVIPEIWLQLQQEAWDEASASGDVVKLGTMNKDNWQSLFVVPTYVIEGDEERGIAPMAPDLKSVFDLDQKQYKELFEDPEDTGKGKILNCVPGWECEKANIAQLAAYELDDDYNLINPGSQAGLFASLTNAYNKGEPWLGYCWGPTWIAGKLDLTRLEEPEYDKAVWEENNGCANPSNDLIVGANKSLLDKAPEVADMFRNWKLNSKTLGEALAYMDETGGEPVDAALWHLKNREEIWTEFVPSDVAEKVKAALPELDITGSPNG